MDKVRLEIKGEPATIPVHAFLTAADNWLRMLQDLDSGISGERKGSLDWFVTDLSTGSLCIEAEPNSRLEYKNIGSEVSRAIVDGLRQIEEEGTTPPYLSPDGLRIARRLLKIIGGNGISGLVMNYGDSKVELSARASANIDQLLPARYRSTGSIEGRLEMISVHRGNRFVVYHSRTRKAIACRFPDDWLDRVKDALGSRVNVAGIIHWNAKGEPVKVDIDDLRILQRGEQLPSIADLAGSDPDLTAGMSTEDYLREIRGG